MEESEFGMKTGSFVPTTYLHSSLTIAAMVSSMALEGASFCSSSSWVTL